ncbi:hypothetical protein ACOMHN_007029 [Nucella lapillus]
MNTDGAKWLSFNDTLWTEDYQNFSPEPTTVGTLVQYGTTDSAESAQRSFVQYELRESLWKVVPPFVLLVGTFGNVMTVLVMRALRTDRSSDQTGGDPSMAVYFPILALCDQAVLTLGLSRQWVKSMFLYDVRTSHALLCKLHKFVVFSVGRMGTWILVAVTSQRIMTVLWPLRQRMSSTRRRAKVVVVVIVGACFLLDAGILVQYFPLANSKGKVKCMPLKDSAEGAFYVDEVYPWLNIVTGSLFPLSILVINNVILSVKVSQAARESRHMAASEGTAVRAKQASSLSLTLIVTSLTFVLLTSSIPVGFFVKRYYLPLLSSSDGQLEADVDLADAVLDLLWYCNSAVNFYLYFLTGPTFRRHARRLLCSGGKRHGGNHSNTSRSDAAPSTSFKDSVRY